MVIERMDGWEGRGRGLTREDWLPRTYFRLWVGGDVWGRRLMWESATSVG
jgi:hypothetical protein